MNERKCICRDCQVGIVNNDPVPKCWTCSNAVCKSDAPCKWRVRVPYGLEFTPGGFGTMRPGDGRAGWTVAVFANLQQAHAFARANPTAYLPCWRRVELWGGKRLGDK